MGGISGERPGRSLNENEKPIAGLYAAGDAIGGLMGGYRGGYTGGLMQAVVTGILAEKTRRVRNENPVTKASRLSYPPAMRRGSR